VEYLGVWNINKQPSPTDAKSPAYPNPTLGSFTIGVEYMVLFALGSYTACTSPVASSSEDVQKTTTEGIQLVSHKRRTMKPHIRVLKLTSDELFTDRVVQRAYNLAWNRPTSESGNDNDNDQDPGTDIVVGDNAIGSPLDALAAWASSTIPHQTIQARSTNKDYTLSEDDNDPSLPTPALH
jgi:hypothetical protein